MKKPNFSGNWITIPIGVAILGVLIWQYVFSSPQQNASKSMPPTSTPSQMQSGTDDDKFQQALGLWKHSGVLIAQNQYTEGIAALENAYVMCYPLSLKSNDALRWLRHFADSLRYNYRHEGRIDEAGLADNAMLALQSVTGHANTNNVFDSSSPAMKPVIELYDKLSKKQIH